MKVIFIDPTDDIEDVELRPRQDGFMVYADKGRGVTVVTMGDGRSGNTVTVPVLKSDVKDIIDALKRSLNT